MSTLQESKKAVYTVITADAALMARLGNKAPYPLRLPKDTPHSRTVAAITYSGSTIQVRGGHEDHTITLSVWAYSHDLAEAVSGDLRRLFHPTSRNRYWVPLPVAGGHRAFIRREFATDVPDPASDLVHISIRHRVKFAPAA